jgi:hypothetical protein
LAGIPPQEYAEFVLFLNYLSLQLCDASRGKFSLGLELVDIQPVDHSLSEPRLANSHRFFPRLQCALGDLHLHIELPKIEIGLGHAAHDLQCDGSSVLFPSQEIRQTRLIRPADSPPDI